MKEIGIILYPHKDFSVEETKNYISLAKTYGYRHVIATFFAVDDDDLRSAQYLKKVKAIGTYCRELDLPFQADLFPKVFEAVNATVDHVQPILDLGITEFRMDYGFTMAELGIISKQEGVQKIILNASTAAESPETFAQDLEQYLHVGGKIEKLEASHNVNPHPETGISIRIMKEIRKVFQSYKIPVSAFAPAKEYSYGIYGVWESCPTVEDHRYWMAYESAQELWAADVADIVYIGDSFASERELKSLSELKDCEHLQLRIQPAYKLSDIEKRVLFSKPLRNCLAEYVLRFVEYRKTNILPCHCVAAQAYDVTIDNQTIKRYNGEIRIALRNQKQDSRINVVGHLHPHDVRLIPYIGVGTMIQLRIDEEEEQ